MGSHSYLQNLDVTQGELAGLGNGLEELAAKYHPEYHQRGKYTEKDYATIRANPKYQFGYKTPFKVTQLDFDKEQDRINAVYDQLMAKAKVDMHNDPNKYLVLAGY